MSGKNNKSSNGRVRGKVKWFNDQKGYGFITPEDGSEDVFVHFKQIRRVGHEFRTLSEGDRVEYSRVPGRNDRFAADDVVKIDG